VYLDRYELMILSRGGRVPRPSRPRPVPLPVPVRSELAGPGRAATLVHALRRRSRRRGQIDVHTYLEMEFAVDDER
jgi:hypothetical protein